MTTDLPSLPEPRLLQLFDVLYGTRSVTRAAEQLGLSQPTVSIWLSRLRRDLRDPLFVRTATGMQPTPRSDTLIGPAREALESLRRLAAWEAVFVPATAQRRFRICMTDASHITLLPQVLAHVRAAAPQVRLEAMRMDMNIGEALASGMPISPWATRRGSSRGSISRRSSRGLGMPGEQRASAHRGVADAFRVSRRGPHRGGCGDRVPAPRRRIACPRASVGGCCSSCRGSWDYLRSCPRPT